MTRMEPIVDANGVLHPELDHRDVPLRVMAAYMHVHRDTLHKQIGHSFPKEAVVKHGSHNYFKPWVWVQVREAVSA